MSNILKPKNWASSWLSGETPAEFLAVIPAVAGTAVAGFIQFGAGHPEAASAYMAASGVSGVATLWKAFAKKNKVDKEQEPHALMGALHTLHAILVATTPKFPDADLRISVFVPHRKPNTVHQLTDYVGPTKSHGAGRDLSSRCGVVGAAFRTGLAQYDQLPVNMDVSTYLVRVHGFDQKEAADMRKDRKCWVAVPVGGPRADEVVAVIYLDSKAAKFFGKANSPCRQMIQAATQGVANYVSAY